MSSVRSTFAFYLLLEWDVFRKSLTMSTGFSCPGAAKRAKTFQKSLSLVEEPKYLKNLKLSTKNAMRLAPAGSPPQLRAGGWKSVAQGQSRKEGTGNLLPTPQLLKIPVKNSSCVCD